MSRSALNQISGKFLLKGVEYNSFSWEYMVGETCQNPFEFLILDEFLTDSTDLNECYGFFTAFSQILRDYHNTNCEVFDPYTALAPKYHH